MDGERSMISCYIWEKKPESQEDKLQKCYHVKLVSPVPLQTEPAIPKCGLVPYHSLPPRRTHWMRVGHDKKGDGWASGGQCCRLQYSSKLTGML